MEKSMQKSSNSEGVSGGCALVLVHASLYKLRLMLSKVPPRRIFWFTDSADGVFTEIIIPFTVSDLYIWGGRAVSTV